MIVIVNGFKESILEGMTIAGLILYLKELDPHLIVELNGKCINPQDYDAYNLLENDVVEFINPCFGG